MRRLVARVDRGLVGAVLLSLLAAVPLIDGRFFFKAHDAPHSVFYLVAFDQAFRDGALWPRWSTDFVFGYGYPVFNVYAPLAYLVAEGFVLLGLGYVGAVKATFLVATVAAAAGMYLLGRRLAGPAAGVVASVVYTYLPYHLLDLYVRAALAEYFAFVWMPLVLWALLGLEEHGAEPVVSWLHRWGRPLALAGVALGGLLLTHNATTLVFVPLLLLFCGWRLVEQVGRSRQALGGRLGRLAGRWAGAGVLGLGLAAIFWLPFAFEVRYLKTEQLTRDQFAYSRHFVEPVQLFSPFWGFGYSDVGLNDTMSFQLGLVALALGGFALAGSPLAIPASARRAAAFFALASGLLVALMLPVAAPLWAVTPGASLLQFPWRLLSAVAVTLAVLAGLAVAGLEARFQFQPLVAVRAVLPLALVAVVGSWPYLRVEPTPIRAADVSPLAIVEFELKSYTATTIWAEELPTSSPMVAQYRRGEPPQKWRLADPQAGSVEQVHHAGNTEEARVRVPNGGRLILQTFDYPGWRVRVDGRLVEHGREPPLGLIAIDLPPGDHVVTARFETTPPRLIGGVLSLLTAALIFLLLAGGLPRRPRAH
ncbi:MAG: hypothetical protein KatS3mg061_0920 [Dehalococcoidia bacterium]|nr:MAG: hypothetical protein KatS3mg061_0920 [Dehalococcoidia bacterium]